MSELLLRAFLEDIKAHPTDDTPRLILADWLEENGQTEADRARGLLIRRQCELARQREGEAADPQLSECCEQLLRQYREAWMAPVTEALDPSFYRGLMSLNATRRQLLDSALLDSADHPGYAWIDEIQVEEYESDEDDLPASWFAALLDAPFMQHPTAFLLRGIALSSAQIRRLARWPGFARLRTLSLFGASTSDEQVEILLTSRHLGPLRKLRLSRGSLSDAALMSLLQHRRLEHLVDLDVGWNEISAQPLPMLRDAVYRDRLQHLSLWSNPMGDPGVEILQQIDLPGLNRLDLGFCNLGPGAMRFLVAAPWVEQLEELHLPSNPLGEGVLTLLQARLVRLRKLRLNFGSLRAEYLGDLVASPGLVNLRDLSIYSSGFGAAEMRTLTQRWALPNVRHLDLCLNALGDEGLRILADWPGLRQFRSLDLSHTTSGDEGLRAVLESPYLHAETKLSLYGNTPSEELRRQAAERIPAVEL